MSNPFSDDEFLAQFSSEQIMSVVDELPEIVVDALAQELPAPQSHIPEYPLEQAQEIDSAVRSRPHLEYLSSRLHQAVADVENGQSRMLMVSMPPRSGKSTLTSVNFPLWVLRKHPDWKIGLISHSPNLATSWGRTTRNLVEENDLGIVLRGDGNAASEWQTTSGGGVWSRSVAESITGLGFKVLLLDDLVKDFASAHSPTQRNATWDWWKTTSASRLEEPYLVVAIGTRWHEDDILGRFRSREYEGEPDDWETISFPAVAEEGDVLGRTPGEPLFSPLQDEHRDDALIRWAETKKLVGSYSWSSLYQQRPAPAEGSVFDVGWFKYWTTDMSNVGDGVVYFNPEDAEQWLDSWDFTFKDTATSDYVVGQRWCRYGADRYLVTQRRGRWSFSDTLSVMRNWSVNSQWADKVRLRLVEEKANGAAIINTLRSEISGLRPVNPKDSKESRARAATPEMESGNVFLPYPGEKGNEWVQDLIGELRNFPHDAHDDQVDAMTQALNWLARSSKKKGTKIKADVF